MGLQPTTVFLTYILYDTYNMVALVKILGHNCFSNLPFMLCMSSSSAVCTAQTT